MDAHHVTLWMQEKQESGIQSKVTLERSMNELVKDKFTHASPVSLAVIKSSLISLCCLLFHTRQLTINNLSL